MTNGAYAEVIAMAVRWYLRYGPSHRDVEALLAERLLAEAERTEAGYRPFTPDDIAVLRFIRRAKTLDLGLAGDHLHP